MRLTVAWLLLLLGCTSPEPSGRLEVAAAPEASETREVEANEAPLAEQAAGANEDLFGAAPDDGLPLTPLAAIVQAPESYRDQVVRTEGQIARVCQRMGCWMELRDGDDGPAVRVPMAGHAFFLPRDAAGRHATMQGRVALRELTPAARAHLEGEGAVATRDALSIEATGVVID